jgi:hypothetical protein
MSVVWMPFRIFELRYCIIDHWVSKETEGIQNGTDGQGCKEHDYRGQKIMQKVLSCSDSSQQRLTGIKA